MARLHRDVLRTVLARIAAGDPPPGAMLPKEVELAAQLGVSRGVARECIRALEERGVVRVTHGRGATVRAPRAWDVLDPEVLAAGDRRLQGEAAEALAIVQGELAALAAARSGPPAVLAGELARLAAERATAALDGLAAAVDAVETAPDEGLEAAGLAFERALAEAAGNRPLARVADALGAALGGAAPSRRDRHRRVLEAIRSGDPAAARAAMAAVSGARPR